MATPGIQRSPSFCRSQQTIRRYPPDRHRRSVATPGIERSPCTSAELREVAISPPANPVWPCLPVLWPLSTQSTEPGDASQPSLATPGIQRSPCTSAELRQVAISPPSNSVWPCLPVPRPLSAQSTEPSKTSAKRNLGGVQLQGAAGVGCSEVIKRLNFLTKSSSTPLKCVVTDTPEIRSYPQDTEPRVDTPYCSYDN